MGGALLMVDGVPAFSVACALKGCVGLVSDMLYVATAEETIFQLFCRCHSYIQKTIIVKIK